MRKFALLVLLAASSPAFALDGVRLARHLRESLNLDTRTPIEVQGQPRPSGLGDLDKVTVLVGGAPYDVYVTKDGSTYFWGIAANLATSPDQQRAAAINLKGAHSMGASTATVTVVEYSDFACSYCRRAHEILSEKLYKTYTPGQVRWVFKNFPLTTHPWAAAAAVAAECASRQKPAAFWSMADYFFSAQNEITEENVREKSRAQAAKLGLKAGAFSSCLDDPAVKESVSNDKKEGASIGVSSTPTIFVNGRMRRGFRDFEDIRVLIDEKLKDAGQ